MKKNPSDKGKRKKSSKKSAPQRAAKLEPELKLDHKNIEDKLLKYVLNKEHELGKDKAKYFESIGYTAENWKELAVQLKFDPKKATKRAETDFGQPYEQKITIDLPDGKRTRIIVTGWMHLKGTKVIRLTTITPN